MGVFDSGLFDSTLFDEPGSALSEAVVLTTATMSSTTTISGLSDSSYIVTDGNLTKVGFSDVGTKRIRRMSWSRIP